MRPIGALSMAPPPTRKRESGVDSAKESRPSARVPSPTGTVRFAFDAPMRVSDAAAIMGLPRASRRACSARAESCRNEAKARSSSRLSPACGAGKSGNPAALAGVGEAKAAASASSSARMPWQDRGPPRSAGILPGDDSVLEWAARWAMDSRKGTG